MISLPRWIVIVALVGVIMACLGALRAGGVATREAALASMAEQSVEELAWLAGLSDGEGRLQREQTMAVELISDGGPMWALPAVEHAVEASELFSVGASRHLLRVEVIDASAAIALQLHLWREGWELRVPEPRRVRISPWAAVVGAILGALAVVLTGRVGIGLGVAGLSAQLGLALEFVPGALFPPRPLLRTWAEGPLFSRVIALIREMSATQAAFAAALLAASLVLVAFDHRGSGSEDAEGLNLPVASLLALAAGLGALAWVEAASRGSLFASLDLRFGWTSGWVALAGLILAWMPALHVARGAWRERR